MKRISEPETRSGPLAPEKIEYQESFKGREKEFERLLATLDSFGSTMALDSYERMQCDVELLVEYWRSTLHHISGQHSWEDDETFLKFRSCVHPDLIAANIGFLSPDSDSYTAVEEIIENPTIQNRLR